jgi:hypothetical protein
MPAPMLRSTPVIFATRFNRDQGKSKNTLDGILKKDFEQFARSVEAGALNQKPAPPLHDTGPTFLFVRDGSQFPPPM